MSGCFERVADILLDHGGDINAQADEQCDDAQQQTADHRGPYRSGRQ